MIRKPAVAGMFYPAEKQTLTQELQRCTEEIADKEPCIGALCPHAGYMFSGRVAGELYSQISIPRTVIILAPNHRGPVVPFALSTADAWQTPLGDASVDQELAAAIQQEFPGLTPDDRPHEQEHAAEVQVPFIQFLQPEAKIIPILISEHDSEELIGLGKAIAKCVDKSNALIVASSDMTHFEDAGTAKKQDESALEKLLALDARGLHQTIVNNRISMCGFGPAVSMLAATEELGATKGELVRYANSGDVTGDFSSVVGYASARIF